MNTGNGPYNNNLAQAKAAYYAKRRVGTSNSNAGARTKIKYFGD